ncbi:MAG: hypothetical protein JST82_13880 [Bacteroidetes bacterium]|nr:hypothetical protein [Bacteroidota bacterium]
MKLKMQQMNMNVKLIIMVMVQRSNFYIIALSILFSFQLNTANGQVKMVKPKFSYTQIDSLIKNVIAKTVTKNRHPLIVSNVYWYVGSSVDAHGKSSAYKNHFEIYINFIDGNDFFVKKIDNFGIHPTIKIENKEIKNFINQHYKAMKDEKLANKVDTIIKDGKQIFITSVIDHELVRQIKIYSENDTLQYEYPSSFSSNKQNIQTHKYYFLQILNNTKEKYNNYLKR